MRVIGLDALARLQARPRAAGSARRRRRGRSRRPSRRARAARGSRRTGASPSSRRAASSRSRARRAARGSRDVDVGPVGHPQVRLVGVALLDERLRRERRRRLVGARARADRGKRAEQLVERRRSSGTCSRLPTRNAPPRAPAQRRSRKATIASRVNVRRCSSGPSTGRPERVVAERRAVDQVLGDDRRLVLGARDLLDDDAALAVELLGVDLRAPDEVGQQVDRLAAPTSARHGDVEGDEVVATCRRSATAPMRSAVSLTLR